MELMQPENNEVLRYLSRGKEPRDTPVLAPWNSVKNPYYNCGSHPEIVERLWDQIGKSLPANCRGLIYGCPTLTHPGTGVILAIGIGTQYGLRLPTSLVPKAIRLGAKTHTTWSGGSRMDIQRLLGENWVFGAWLADELDWCGKAYETFGPKA